MKNLEIKKEGLMSSFKTYYEDEFASVLCIEESSTIYLNWNGYSFSEQFRIILNKALELINKKGYQKLISDNRKARAVNPQDHKWLLDEWIPNANSLGLQKVAFIESENIFNKLKVEQLMPEMAGNQILANVFKTSKDALKWLII